MGNNAYNRSVLVIGKRGEAVSCHSYISYLKTKKAFGDKYIKTTTLDKDVLKTDEEVWSYFKFDDVFSIETKIAIKFDSNGVKVQFGGNFNILEEDFVASSTSIISKSDDVKIFNSKDFYIIKHYDTKVIIMKTFLMYRVVDANISNKRLIKEMQGILSDYYNDCMRILSGPNRVLLRICKIHSYDVKEFILTKEQVVAMLPKCLTSSAAIFNGPILIWRSPMCNGFTDKRCFSDIKTSVYEIASYAEINKYKGGIRDSSAPRCKEAIEIIERYGC
jgi:hypothetical protein